MDFGMPTLLELGSLPETVELCVELGLQFVEINMNMPQYQLASLSAVALRDLQRAAVYFTIHLDENLNVWDFNPLVSKAYSDTVFSAIQFAAEAGIPILNMHMNPGVSFTLPEQKVFLFERHKDAYMEKTQWFRQKSEEAAGKSGVRIGIENCDGYPGFQLEAIERFLESPMFGLTFDIGHNHTAGQQDEPFILRHENKLCHMHVHDAASAQSHLAVGAGEIDVGEKLMLAERRHCRCVLETKTIHGLRASVHHLRKHYPMHWRS